LFVKLVVVLAATVILFYACAVFEKQLIAWTVTSRLAPRSSCCVTHQEVFTREPAVGVHFALTLTQGIAINRRAFPYSASFTSAGIAFIDSCRASLVLFSFKVAGTV